MNKSEIFVIHGRNEKLRRALYDFLRSLRLNPLEWAELLADTGKSSPYTGEVVEQGFRRAAAVVALLTPDDFAFLNPELLNERDREFERKPTPQARPNVLFELGMAFAHHPDRTVIVQIGELRPFSDVAGRHVIHFDGSPEARNELRSRLHTAGCDMNPSGTDWLTSGDFSSSLNRPKTKDTQTATRSPHFTATYMIAKANWIAVSAIQALCLNSKMRSYETFPKYLRSSELSKIVVRVHEIASKRGWPSLNTTEKLQRDYGTEAIVRRVQECVEMSDEQRDETLNKLVGSLEEFVKDVFREASRETISMVFLGNQIGKIDALLDLGISSGGGETMDAMSEACRGFIEAIYLAASREVGVRSALELITANDPSLSTKLSSMSTVGLASFVARAKSLFILDELSDD